MPAKIISGKAIGQEMREELKPQIEELKSGGVTPGLAVVLVGEDPASQVYVRMKGKACESAGMHLETVVMPEATTQDELLAVIDRLNNDDKVHGILCQLPVPDRIDETAVLRAIRVDKDVDGFHPENVGKVATADPTGFAPATPLGVIHMLLRSGVDTRGAHAVVVGRSNIVGRPMASLLLHRGEGGDATVTVCHSKTRDLPAVAREAEILVVSTGRPAMVTREFIRPGATVLDVGINRLTDAGQVEEIFQPLPERLEQFRTKGSILVGDVHPGDVAQVAGAYTPVPGGVGPLTVAMLMVNTVRAARLRRATG